jgi:hypothetical protein
VLGGGKDAVGDLVDVVGNRAGQYRDRDGEDEFGRGGAGLASDPGQEVAGGIRREVLGRSAVGEERERLWRRWSDLDHNLDGYTALRPRGTAVVVLELRVVAE